MSNDQIVSSVLSLFVSLGGAAGLVRILTLRQDRRKVAGDASMAEANAGVALSGAAMAMLENEQQQRREADARAAQAELERQQTRNENSRVWAELTATQWKALHLERREAQLEQFIVENGLVPPAREGEHGTPVDTPPPLDGPRWDRETGTL